MYIRPTVAVVIGLVICLVLTGLAATIAGSRSSMAYLDVDVASALRADYSTDPRGARFVPIDPEIIEVARDDAERVAPPEAAEPGEEIVDDSPVEFVPIFRAEPTPAPSVAPSPAPDDSATTPTPTPDPALTQTPQPTNAEPPAAPTEGPTFSPTPTPAQGPTFSPTPTPAQGATFSPTPTPTPAPTSKPTPT
ncbi:MAG: hypothetical protein DRI30_06335, partial [Chloroflexi bacterium]